MASLAALAIAGAALSACGLPIGPGNCTPKGGSSEAGTTTVKVVSDPQASGAYQPKAVTVQSGQSVTWSWDDQGNQHSVTAEDGSFDSCLHGNGYSFTVSFAKPGTYSYKCSIHPQMTGRITVT
jgi:YD repeat-containing protein